jgi:hypothetical protein
MRTLFLFLTIGFISPLLWAGEGGDKKKDKNKDQYYKYEREDVSSYRDRRTFDMPPLPEPTIVEVEEVDPETISLEPLFRGGRKVYLDADERLGLMVAREIPSSNLFPTLSLRPIRSTCLGSLAWKKKNRLVVSGKKPQNRKI